MVRPRARVRRLHESGNGGRGVYILPNLITTAGLFCGVFSIAQTVAGEYFYAALAILAAQLFDILDGRVARLTNSTSNFGVEYDSLSDLVSFGVAPGLLIYRWALLPWGVWGWLAAALFVCCAALRLARFNTMIGVTPTGFFVGLPVPAAAAMLAGVLLLYNWLGRSGLPDKHLALLLAVYTLAALMVSNLPYPTFKQLRLHKRQPLWILVVAILLLNFLIARYQLVVFCGVSLYVLSGPVLWIVRRAAGFEALPILPSQGAADDDEESSAASWPEG
ncbi:MAG: CDP-diacylglycerol--serine O-phosphatidyltransferase [Deltaproteobacteria bacterium]|nr:MAG: CDP-diacylglycerol--serine O-phosphatidyltransferase [Deltaproteobacteria bacterium]